MSVVPPTRPPAGLAEARQGMRSPRPVTLAAGTRLVRFGDSAWAPDTLCAGNWWVRESDYLRHEALNPPDKLAPGLHWRGALAVPQSRNNRMDVIIFAALLQPVEAFAGLARPQRRAEQAENGAWISWMGSTTLEQIYIHGLAETSPPWRLTSFGRDSIRLLFHTTIQTHLLPIPLRR